jgi:hypothetical protein
MRPYSERRFPFLIEGPSYDSKEVLRPSDPTRRMVNLKDPSVLEDNNRLTAVGDTDG